MYIWDMYIMKYICNDCCYVEKLKLDHSIMDHDAIAHRLQEDVVSCLYNVITVRWYHGYMLL